MPKYGSAAPKLLFQSGTSRARAYIKSDVRPSRCLNSLTAVDRSPRRLIDRITAPTEFWRRWTNAAHHTESSILQAAGRLAEVGSATRVGRGKPTRGHGA